VALEVARRLVWNPNPDASSTGAAISEFINEGSCTIILDELDHIDTDGQRQMRLIWNRGHNRGAQHGKKVNGVRTLINLWAPMIAAGVGNFMGQTQNSRAFRIEMAPYTEETKPERDYYAEQDFGDFDIVYSYLRQWRRQVKLNPKPAMPRDIIARYADNPRGLLSIADSCGAEWGEKAREAILDLHEKDRAERPHIVILRHGIEIFDTLGVDKIGSLNRELKQLDLPDAKWTRYCGASGMDYTHPIAMHEQAALLKKAGFKSKTIRFDDGSRKGYLRAQFEEALRKASSTSGPRLRLVSET
jgi:hypothetical protein